MVAKLASEKMIPCPKQGRDGRGGLHMDLPRFYRENPHRAAEDGYYPVRHTKRPAGDPVLRWTLRSGEIVQVWSPRAAEQDADDTVCARLGRIEDSLQKILAAVSALQAGETSEP